MTPAGGGFEGQFAACAERGPPAARRRDRTPVQRILGNRQDALIDGLASPTRLRLVIKGGLRPFPWISC